MQGQRVTNNGSNLLPRNVPVPKEEAILNTVRNKLREAYHGRHCGEVFFRFCFRNGGIARRTVGAQVEYEFTDDSEPA
jgi:hypothetical protein